MTLLGLWSKSVDLAGKRLSPDRSAGARRVVPSVSGAGVLGLSQDDTPWSEAVGIDAPRQCSAPLDLRFTWKVGGDAAGGPIWYQPLRGAVYELSLSFVSIPSEAMRGQKVHEPADELVSKQTSLLLLSVVAQTRCSNVGPQ